MQHLRRVLAAVLAAVLVAATNGCADGGGSDPDDTDILQVLGV